MTTLAVLTQRIKAQPAHSQAPVTAQPWKEAERKRQHSNYSSTLFRLSGAFHEAGLLIIIIIIIIMCALAGFMPRIMQT